jgi:hypothetical protein
MLPHRILDALSVAIFMIATEGRLALVNALQRHLAGTP